MTPKSPAPRAVAAPPPGRAPSVAAAEQVDFLLLPGFSMMGFVSAIEPLRVANRFRPGAYRWRLLSADGAAVAASNGMSLNVDAGLETSGLVPAGATGNVWLIVVAGFDPLATWQPALGASLRAARRAGAALGAVDTGVFVLAEAGVAGPGPVTLHWEAQSAFRERYPQIAVSDELFVATGGAAGAGAACTTCAGGTAAIDMMLAHIAARHGHALAVQVSEQFVLGRIRSRSDHQQMEITARYRVHNPRVVQAIALMRDHIEDPLAPDDLARLAGVTRRQLERLFAAHLQTTPGRFYTALRLEHARGLLQGSDLAVTAIGVACGFGSGAHFARSYRAAFGRSPKEERAGQARA